MANVKHSSATVEHYTPSEYVEAARHVLGQIDLDPASTPFVNKTLVKAKGIFTEEANGISQQWSGRVFLNPPGGYCSTNGLSGGRLSSQKVWWEKLAHEYMEGHVHSAIFVGFSLELLQSSQDQTQLFSPFELPIPLDFPLCFPAKRIKFLRRVGDELVPGDQPTHANVIVFLPRLWGSHDQQRFIKEFSPLGRTVWPRVPNFRRIPR